MSVLFLPPSAENLGKADFTRLLGEAHRRARDLIRSEHREGLDCLEVMGRLTRLMDELLGAVWQRAESELLKEGVERDPKLVLAALGSYGRRELAPHSDVDILFLHPDRLSSWTSGFNERVLYSLWDLGLDVGYGTRSLKDSFQLASDNFDVLTSLLDTRYLLGDTDLHRSFREDLRRRVLSRVKGDYIRVKLAEMEERVAKHGGSIYVLEPNVKEGMGGLRDIQTVLWVAKVLFQCERLEDLQEQGLMDERDLRHLVRSHDFLLRVRCELHFSSNAARDILSMERQPFLAERFHFRAKDGVPGVERFMQVYYTHCGQVRQLTDSVIKRALEKERKVPRILDRFREKDLGEGYFARDGAIHTRKTPVEVFRSNPAALMGVFELFQRTNLELSPELALGVRRSLNRVNEPFRSDPAIRQSFFRILGEDRRLYETLLLMNELRFLGRYFPEFDRIFCKMQHDYYHYYTVDEHSIRAIREVIELPRSEDPALEIYRKVYTELRGRRHLLLLAILLHDAGKGYGSGHAERGARLGLKAAERMNLAPREQETLSFLIQHHLAMAHTAQRRDLHDERTITEFARLVETPERLQLLLLLTMADIKAVGPGVWNEWKANLIAELFRETVRVLEAGGISRADVEERVGKRAGEVERRLADHLPREWVRAELARLPQRAFSIFNPGRLAQLLTLRAEMGDERIGTAWHQERRLSHTEFHVVAFDAPGLFAKIAGVLTANSVNILSAQIFTREDGIVFDVLQVTDNVMRPITDPMKQRIVSTEMARVIAGEIKVQDLVASRRLTLPLDRREKAARKLPHKVEVDNQASDRHTVLDVYATDRIGLLYSITSTLASLGLSIHNAKVSTKVDQAVDVFYVTDIEGRKIEDEGRLGVIKDTLLAVLEGPKN